MRAVVIYGNMMAQRGIQVGIERNITWLGAVTDPVDPYQPGLAVLPSLPCAAKSSYGVGHVARLAQEPAAVWLLRIQMTTGVERGYSSEEHSV